MFHSITCKCLLQIFHSLRGAGIELREECGKCLGELGAIDPGKYVNPFCAGIQLYQ